jgi:hypothetical protein
MSNPNPDLTCPKCKSNKMGYEAQVGACCERFICVCGNSVFEFTKMAEVNFDLLPSFKR